MIGALVGDILGSPFERRPVKREDVPLFGEGTRFTDDSLLTVAVAATLLSGRDTEEQYAAFFREYGSRYPECGFGRSFRAWLRGEGIPGGSFGNGSAMRVSPVGYAFETLEQVLDGARRSAAPSHGHPEGIKGAQAVAAAVFLARKSVSRDEIVSFLQERFGYDFSRPLALVRRSYVFDATCPGSVPEALLAFLESTSFEDAVRKAISLGGDADTQACIAGAVAEAWYGGIPEDMALRALSLLPEELLRVTAAFASRFLPHWRDFPLFVSLAGKQEAGNEMEQEGKMERLAPQKVSGEERNA